MPTTARPTARGGEGSEPAAAVNPDPPRLPGRGSDVDAHLRVENVAPMVPAIPLEGALAALIAAEPPVPQPAGTYVGYTPPPLVPTGLVHDWEPGGDRYLVCSRPWMNAVVDDRFVTARVGDVVVLTPSTARRYLDTGALLPEPAPGE